MNPFWTVRNGYFTPFEASLEDISEEGKLFSTRVQKLELNVSIFIRGSIVEAPNPFHLSDLDVIVIHDEEDPHYIIRQLQGLTKRFVDVKLLQKEELEHNIIQWALLKHRSIQIYGPPIPLYPLQANFDFAWEHWCCYFPMGIPSVLKTEDPLSLIFFKHLTRSLGVLSFLEDQTRFTRDITTCISLAEHFIPNYVQVFLDFRVCLEKKDVMHIKTINIVRKLQQRFDAL